MTELRGELTLLRTMEPAHHAELIAIHQTPAVLAWWGEMEEGFPVDEPTSTRYTVFVDDRIAGMIQWGEETQPDYRHAWIDIFLSPDRHGRGYATDAVRTLAGHILGSGAHHRITIDPAVANIAAVRAYEKAGFRRVGVMEASWLGPDGVWQDSLMMEMVRRPEPGAAPV